MRRLGTVSQARDALGHQDGAETWEAITRGELVAIRGENPDRPDEWTVYLPEDTD